MTPIEQESEYSGEGSTERIPMIDAGPELSPADEFSPIHANMRKFNEY